MATLFWNLSMIDLLSSKPARGSWKLSGWVHGLTITHLVCVWWFSASMPFSRRYSLIRVNALPSPRAEIVPVSWPRAVPEELLRSSSFLAQRHDAGLGWLRWSAQWQQTGVVSFTRRRGKEP
jgi:hypothetical protein